MGLKTNFFHSQINFNIAFKCQIKPMGSKENIFTHTSILLFSSMLKCDILQEMETIVHDNLFSIINIFLPTVDVR